MAKKLPNIVYLFRDCEGTDDEFLLAGETVDELAEKDELRQIGEYRLVKTVKVSVETKIVQA